MKYKLHFKKYMIIVQKNYMFHIRRLFRHDARPGIQEHKQRMLIILDIFLFLQYPHSDARLYAYIHGIMLHPSSMIMMHVHSSLNRNSYLLNDTFLVLT